MKSVLMCSLLTLAMVQAASAATTKAEAKLAPTAGNKASGTVTFEQDADSVWVKAKVEGLTPGLHGFHIHEKGDCSAPDGSSAGGHFNPLTPGGAQCG